MSETLYLHDTITTPEGEVEGRFMVEWPGDIMGLGLFRSTKNRKPTTQASTLLDLSEPQRCYHTHEETEELHDGLGISVLRRVRCENPALQDGKHGWLCETHSDEVRGTLAQLRFEAERQIIADILLTERMALKSAKRETVRLSLTQSITYLVR